MKTKKIIGENDMYSLLLVDDESIILEGIYEVIKEAGMPLKEIQTASSALVVCCSQPSDLAVGK